MALTYYFDEDASDSKLVRALLREGLDVAVPAEAGLMRADDAGHLRFATASGRVLVSSNPGDFYALHTVWLTSGLSHAGIVLIAQQQFSIGERVRRLVLVSELFSPDEFIDRLEFLSDWG